MTKEKAVANMVRVNTRIPKYINDWMDEQSAHTGVPKSTQILLALDAYYKQKEMPNQLLELQRLIAEAKNLEQK